MEERKIKRMKILDRQQNEKENKKMKNWIEARKKEKE